MEECLPRDGHSAVSCKTVHRWSPAHTGRRRQSPAGERSLRQIMHNERKVAVVTGASQGISAGLVKAFRDRNYLVVATSRSIKQSGDPDIVAVAGDIGDPATAERIVKTASARFGRIDTLVNNAGIFIAKPFTDYTAQDFVTKIATNLAGFFYVTQRVA